MSTLDDLKKALKEGKPVRFPRNAPEAERTIDAATILEAASDSKRIYIRNAVVTGPLLFRNTTVSAEILLLNCRLDAPVDFSSSTFERNLVLSFCRFERRPNFQSMTAKYDLRLGHAEFKSATANFRNIHVAGNWSSRKAVFHGYAVFSDAEFGPDVDFSYCRFRGASFNSVKVKGTAHFEGAVFEQKAELGALTVERDLDCESAHFLGNADFSDVNVGIDFILENAEISRRAWFVGLRVGGGAVFRRAKFFSTEKTRFDLAHFQGGAFCQKIKFVGPVDFRGVQFDLDASFGGAEFQGAVSFEASRFTGLAEFKSGDWEGQQFGQPVFQDLTLKHARFEQDAHFDDAVFRGNADFRDATFQVVYFSRSGQVTDGGQVRSQFQGTIDVRGCTYKAIDADWRSLLPRNQVGIDYNRQPYTQLEKFYSGIGESTIADEVYLERREAERNWNYQKRRYLKWLNDLAYYRFLNYGVRPWQLLILAVLLLAAGTGFFTQQHAVAAKSEKEKAPDALCALEAFEVSLHQFLPVDIPLGEQWVPAHDGIPSGIGFPIRPSTFATFFLRLPGWTLVPLGIASFTRLLRGSAGAKPGG